MEALEVAGQRAAARGEESRYRRNRSPTEASAPSGYGVPGREANAPTLDVGPFPTLSAPEEASGSSVARAATQPATPGTGTAAPSRPPSSVSGPTVARFEPGEARGTETAEPSRACPSQHYSKRFLPARDANPTPGPHPPSPPLPCFRTVSPHVAFLSPPFLVDPPHPALRHYLSVVRQTGDTISVSNTVG